MPAATSSNSMPARDVLNSYVEDLFIKDIQDNYDELVERKKDTTANLLVEKYWVVFKKILDDADEIGYRGNEKLREFAIDMSLKLIDAFVEVIQSNAVPEPKVEQYCVRQIDLMIDIVKRYDVGTDYNEQIAGILCRYCERYVEELDYLPFEEFYKYARRLEVEKSDAYCDQSLHEMGIRLYGGRIEDFIERFKNDEDPQLRYYIEDLELLIEKTDSFGFLDASSVIQRVETASAVFIEGSMERKYRQKEVIREVIKRFIAVLTKYEIIDETFWNVLTDTLTRYMQSMAENDERENLKFYWLFSSEIGVLDRVGLSLDDAVSSGKFASSGAASKKSSSTKKSTRRKSSGGLKEL